MYDKQLVLIYLLVIKQIIQTRTKRVPEHLFDLSEMAESLIGYGGYGWTWTTDPSIMNIDVAIFPSLPYNTFKNSIHILIKD